MQESQKSIIIVHAVERTVENLSRLPCLTGFYGRKREAPCRKFVSGTCPVIEDALREGNKIAPVKVSLDTKYHQLDNVVRDACRLHCP